MQLAWKQPYITKTQQFFPHKISAK